MDEWMEAARVADAARLVRERLGEEPSEAKPMGRLIRAWRWFDRYLIVPVVAAATIAAVIFLGFQMFGCTAHFHVHFDKIYANHEPSSASLADELFERAANAKEID